MQTLELFKRKCYNIKNKKIGESYENCSCLRPWWSEIEKCGH